MNRRAHWLYPLFMLAFTVAVVGLLALMVHDVLHAVAVVP